MGIFDGLVEDDSIQEDTDFVGGFQVLDSGVYDATIDMAYVDKSSGGALNVNFVFKTQDGKELKQTIYVSSGDKKGNLNYYIDKKGNKNFLTGYNLVKAITLLTIGKELSAVDTEVKTLNIYDYTAKKEIPQKKEVIMELLGQDITLGVLKVIENKNTKNAQGIYVPSAETRTFNEVDKIFRTKDRLTVAEIKAEATEPGFINTWSEKNTGKVRDKSKAVSGGNSPTAAPAAKTSLFS